VSKINVTMATLENHNHIVGDIERGVKVYNDGGVKFEEREANHFWAHVPHQDGHKAVVVTFSRDGQELENHYCHCTAGVKDPPVCRHVVAAVLAIQGGIVDSKLVLGKTATVSATVNHSVTAKTVGSGSLDVFATPMMIALMEQAACRCLENCLEEGQTSVGTDINVQHTAASLLGAEITATAAIAHISGRKIEFTVTASAGAGQIGSGNHTRVIVDAERFMKKAGSRK